MERNHEHSQSSSAAQTLNSPRDESNLEGVRVRAETFRKLLDQVRNGRLEVGALLQRLQEAGASPAEARDYLEQAREHFRHECPDRNPETSHTDAEPDGLGLEPDQAADAVIWAQLQQRLSDIARAPEAGPSAPSLGLGDLAKIFDLAKPRPAAIPPEVLAEAPHLQEYLTTTQADDHLERTWKLKQTYATEKATDAIVDLMQRHPMPDPLPRSVWKDIVLDKYVDFEKLYAGMERGYDHDDEPKDFAGGYSIVKKDHFRSKKPVQTESEWGRVARAWKQAVELLYPHRKSELTTYMEFVDELFRAAPQTPSIAICVDVDARDRYAKHPYRMDDRNQLHPSVLAQMLRAPSLATLGKRSAPPGPSSMLPNKKPYAICRNWNFGTCNADECPYQRTHGLCCECGEAHRAKEQEDCLAKLKKRRRPTGRTKPPSDNK
jgi:hypothetical protein